MKEIKVVLNNDEETFRNNPFNVYIDGIKLENINRFRLEATMPTPDKNGIINMDEIIRYSTDCFVPYFEKSEQRYAEEIKPLLG